MVELGLRSVVNTEISRSYLFGDVVVGVQQNYVENLGRDGVVFCSISQVMVQGVARRKVVDDAFVQENGSSVTSGTMRQAWVAEPPFSTAKAVAFCNVTARYKFGIPVYHYTTGISYLPKDFAELSDSDLADPLFAVAKREAEQAGITDVSNPRKATESLTDFLEQGLTMRWGFCDTYDLPKL